MSDEDLGTGQDPLSKHVQREQEERQYERHTTLWLTAFMFLMIGLALGNLLG